MKSGPAPVPARAREASARLSRFWAYAAAYGALWGAVEVTAGSFLHALRIPFAGVLLGSIGAALLVAQRQACDRRGLTLATGLVAALCKSLSPAGIIWNPMVGIVMEALLAEVALLLTSRSRATAALAGALAAAWAVGQGLLMQWVVYGSTVFTLYITVVGKTATWLGFEQRAGWMVLGAVCVVFLAAGAAGGVWGRRIGRLAAGETPIGETGETPIGVPQSAPVPQRAAEVMDATPAGVTGEPPIPQGHTAGRLLPVAIACIALQYPSRPAWSAAALAIWLAGAALFDRASLNRLWQPRFLAVSVLLAALSGLLIGDADTQIAGVRVSSSGLGAGAVMIFRGVLIVGLGAWGARWLLGRAARLQAGRTASLSSAAAAAFQLVPDLGARIRAASADRPSGGGRAWSGSERAAVTLLCQASGLAEGLWQQGGAASGGQGDG